MPVPPTIHDRAPTGNVPFATWFTYAADGRAWWLVVRADRIDANVYRGTLYTGTGPLFSAVPFDPSNVVSTAVGTATFTFRSSSSAITRESFGPSGGTVCH